ncbi:ankyrin repeat-containing domain protein [Lasiosphaeria ovina]|uniref:Ankyrin repeat-containing domain protein n=1 Tax=Lasiosphaeria ovina TaxID=92902 RepID=A0AAE0K403_9PEZI|nr:ankyrin repeat-containing domain protein [Lasiosphaeria ovina]
MPPSSPEEERNWDRHQREIWRLYLLEGKSLKLVMQEMAQRHGFSPSKQQWIDKLKQWGCYKSLPKEGWRYVEHQARKRKLSNSDGGGPCVVLSGVRLSPEQVRKGMRNHCPGPTLKLPRYRCTSWPQNLPWLQFHSQEFRCPHLASLIAGRKADRIHNRLSLFMPENESQEHLIRAESICQQGTQWAARTWLELALFYYSNHLDSPVLSEDEGPGTVLQELVRSETPTAQVLVGRFFASAVRLRHVETLRKLVDAGLNLQRSGLLAGIKDKYSSSGGIIAPINYVLRASDADMVDFLLEHGATFTKFSGLISLQHHNSNAENAAANMPPSLEVADNPPSPRSLPDEVWVDQKDGYSEKEMIDMLRRIPKMSPKAHIKGSGLWVAANRFLERLGKMDAGIGARLQNPLPVLLFAIRYGSRETMAAIMSRVPDLDAESRIDSSVLPTTAMAEAAWAGDVEACKILMARGAKPNPVAASSLSALQIAAHLGNMPLANMLVEKGADVNYSFSGYSDIGSERTALGAAIAEGHALMVEFLLAKGAIATAEDLVGLEPLLPELPGREETVRRLVVNQGEAFTAKVLLNAVRRGDLSLAKLLVQAGADWSYVSETGETPLALAISIGHINVVGHIMETGLTRYDPAALLAATAAVSSATSSSTFGIILDSRRGVGRFHYHQSNEAWTAFLEGMALAAAVCLGDEDRATRLLDAGISPAEDYPLASSRAGYLLRFNLRHDTSEVFGVGPGSRHDHVLTTPGATILGTACMAKQPTMVPILLGRGYQPSHVDLAIAANLIDRTTVGLLLPSAPNHSGILSQLIRRGWKSHVYDILADGGDPNAPQTRIHALASRRPPSTPLKAAILCDDIKLVSHLLSRGAHVSPDSSPLSTAAGSGNIAIVRLLIAHGAGVNASSSSSSGDTGSPLDQSPLEEAAESGKIDVLAYLLSEGVDTADGVHRWRYLRAVRLAEEEGHHAAVKMLREYRDWSQEDRRMFEALDICDFYEDGLGEGEGEGQGQGQGQEQGQGQGENGGEAWGTRGPRWYNLRNITVYAVLMGITNSRPAATPADVAKMRSTASGYQALRVSTIVLSEVEAANLNSAAALSGLESSFGPLHGSAAAARGLMNTLHGWWRHLQESEGSLAQPSSDDAFNRGIKLLDENETWVHATALLDTQCQIGNWISKRLVERLGKAHLISARLDLPQACGIISLAWKWHDPRGIRVHECQFYVFPESPHIDVLFGAKYIMSEDLLRVNESAILPLVEHKKKPKEFLPVDDAAVAAAKERQKQEKAALAERRKKEQEEKGGSGMEGGM